MEHLQDVFVSNLNATANNGGFVSFPHESSWTADWHQFNQNKFYCITKGSCVIEIEDAIYEAKAGDWFFIPVQTVHRFRKNDDEIFEKYWMHFDIYPTETNLFTLLNLPYFVHISPDDEAMKLWDYYSKVTETSLTDILQMKAVTLQLIARYISLAEKSHVTIKSRSDDRLDEVLRYINDNLDKPISNKFLSDLCHLHPNHFIRFFKERTGQTPSHYIKNRKMDTAKTLLEKSDLNISEVMAKVGFDDISYFSKQFKIFYAMSPREYRKYYMFHLKPAEEQL